MEPDYIIVGAGSAGCVIANRLTEEEGRSVLLLEAGGDDRPLANPGQFWTNLLIQVPVGFARLLTDPKAAWLYRSEPDPLGGRVHPFPRGRVLGGSSAINGLLYVRGMAQDFDGWRQRGCHGWGWEDVLPLMLRSEDRPEAGGELAGIGGPQAVRYGPRYRATEAFLNACAEAGIARDVDMNAGGAEGMGYMQMTARNGLRWSTARAYLHPVSGRRNLQVVTRAFVTRLLFEGRRVVGVEYRRGRALARVFARREVIMSAGAINTPKLLQISGIGPAEDLKASGIAPVVDSPAVGRNLQDHFGISNGVLLRHRRDSFNHRTHGWRLAVEAMAFAAFRRGILTNPTTNISGYVSSRSESDLPDMQLFASAVCVDKERTMKAGHMVMRREPGFTAGCYPSRPRSRGTVTLRSNDVDAPPRIAPQYLTDPYDQAVMVAGMRRVRSILNQPSMAAIIHRVLAPADRYLEMSDAELLDDALARGFSGYHACGTCAMSADEGGVVDPELRVRGVTGLRIADASIMPQIVSGNINATCIMIGEKCADIIKASPIHPAENAGQRAR